MTARSSKSAHRQRGGGESQLVRVCLQWLLAHGCYVWRNNTGAYKPDGEGRYIRYGLKGSADIIGLTPKGQFLAVECKVGKNKPSDHQILFGARVVEKNGIYIVVYDVDGLRSQLLKHACLPYSEGI